MNTVDPKLLQVFADVVDQGSFSKAADLRDTDASYITRQIKRLETDLRVTLLNRSTRALALTEAGKLVYDNARQLNSLMKTVATIAEDQSTTPRGDLRITSAVYIGRKYLRPIVEKICDTYPDVSIDLQLHDGQADLIKEHFDLAFRVWQPKDEDLIAKKLIDVRFLLVASPDFIQRHGQPETIEDLQPLPAIVYGRKGHAKKTFHYYDDNGSLKTFPIKSNLCINDAEELNNSVMNGQRYCLATNFMATEHLQSGALVQLLPDVPLPLDDAIYAVYPNRDLSKVARMIIAEMKAALSVCA